MTTIERLLSQPPYSLGKDEKNSLLGEELWRLTAHHRERCEPYRRMTGAKSGGSLGEVPMLPVRLFKLMELQSIPSDPSVKTLKSSGTTSANVSRIAVDRETSQLQTKALACIMKSLLGGQRLPMIFIDSAGTVQGNGGMSARGAGLVGLANFGRDHLYALDGEMRLNIEAVKNYIQKYSGQPIVVFGFTFMIWRHFCQELRKSGEKLSLENGIVLHGGGWKALADLAVDNNGFKRELNELCGIKRVFNFYGMVEQLGNIYLECEKGHLHASNFSEILIRDAGNWRVVEAGKSGVIQTLSILPWSYPGHSLLTEDVGTVLGVDDCGCGRLGTYFSVQGRVPQAELRGCSDTHAEKLKSIVPAGAGTISQFLPVRAEADSIEEICSAKFLGQKALPAFEAAGMDFLAEVSRSIFALEGVKEYPEMMALAFWLRKGNLAGVIESFRKSLGGGERVMPRGVAFHIAPSNVDTIFVYSWALSLLAGNVNVVRVSQNLNNQLGLLLSVLQTVVAQKQFAGVAERNLVLTYPRDEKINRYLSEAADLRVVWGGDATVRTIRGLPTKPGTKDIVFPDRRSACVIHASRYSAVSDAEAAQIAERFFNDAYQFDQMACSSPRIVYFVGNTSECEKGSERFWEQLRGELWRRKYAGAAAAAIDKLVTMDVHLASGEDVEEVSAGGDGPTVLRITAERVGGIREACGGGFFFECFVERLEDLAPLMHPSDQTLSYSGFSRQEMEGAAEELCLNGIVRIVPIGQALAFAPVWDGYVLLGEMTRRITVG